MTVFFTASQVTDYDSAKTSDTAQFAIFHQAMLERGFYLPPSQFEAIFISAAHTVADIDQTIDAAREAMNVVANKR